MQKEQQKKDKFNPNQALAVYTTDRDILVSAGAGCGKTFVMIERIAENIINKAVSVDEPPSRDLHKRGGERDARKTQQ